MADIEDTWARVEKAIYATTVSRSAIDFEWPECHRKGCPGRHGDPDEAFRIFARQIADSVRRALTSEESR